MKYLFVHPQNNKKFWIVTCERNAGEAAIHCLNSVYKQSYNRDLIHHLFIDDASTDNTHALVQEWLATHPGNPVHYIRHQERKGRCFNNLMGFRMAPLDSIVIELNGDDWFPDPDVLAFLNKVYSDPEVWMTNNSSKFADGVFASLGRPFSKKVIRENIFRETQWYSGALHTFRAKLIHLVRQEDLIDPLTGVYWENSDDFAYYFPILEMCGEHARHLYRINYVYNFRDISERNIDQQGSLERGERIRKLQKYHRLKKLS